MTIPTLLIGSVIAILYGVLFHLWRGGRISRLILYIALSWVGFWIGQLIASYFEFTFFSIGQLHLGMASLTSLLFIGVGYWLSLVDQQHK